MWRPWRVHLGRRSKSSVILACSAKQIATSNRQRNIMPDNLKQPANAHFRTQKGNKERKTVISESEAGAAATVANTTRLKGLRLARDAAEQARQHKIVSAVKTSSKKKFFHHLAAPQN
jgi:hypothetical protein